MSSQQSRGVYIVVVIVLYILYYYFCCDGYLWRFDVQSIIPHGIQSIQWVKYDPQTSTAYENNLRYNWLRLHRTRTDWRAMLNPCSDQMSWGTLKSSWGKANRSSAKTSYVSYMDIQPSGQFSRIFIQTRTASGQMKTIGGDFWRVLFTGPASVSATVFDHRNGTYEAIALLVETGYYSVRAYLDYSLCDGLRDPPGDWFRIGNAQGKRQLDGVLGHLDHYIYEPLKAAENISLEVLPSKHKSQIDDLSNITCNKSCRCLWDGHGRWRKNVWLPYLSGNRQRRGNVITPRKTTPHRGTLWIIGDSLGVRFHFSLSQKPLCKVIFAQCSRSYNWLYPLPGENEALGKSLMDDLDFRPDVILDSIRNVLRRGLMKSPHSLLVLNLGLHYPISISFASFQKLIDDVIVMLWDREKGLGSRARVVWKTTTSIRKENEKPPRNETHWRFFTEPRIRLFDAYAMSEMCKAGIEVLDVFPITASYLPGTLDVVHYKNEVFDSAELELETYARAGGNYESTPVCFE